MNVEEEHALVLETGSKKQEEEGALVWEGAGSAHLIPRRLIQRLIRLLALPVLDFRFMLVSSCYVAVVSTANPPTHKKEKKKKKMHTHIILLLAAFNL
eukprot:2476405-Rhodomonas_salina.1